MGTCLNTFDCALMWISYGVTAAAVLVALWGVSRI